MHVSESAEQGEGENVRANVWVIALTDHTTYRQQILNESYLVKYSKTNRVFLLLFFSR